MFLAKGKYRKGKKWVVFTKEVAAETKERVIEKIYSEVGSNHKVRRGDIIIEGVEKIGKGVA